MRKILLSIASLMLFSSYINATNIGYSKENIVRTNKFRVGNAEKQGQAIRLSHAKLQALKGKTIDFAEFVVASKNTTENKIHAFLSTSLDGEPIAEADIAVSAAFKKCKWTLDKPYTITGEEQELYIGYTAEIANTYKLLMADYSYDIKGCNFAYKDNEWVDTYGTNRGSAYIFVNADDVDDYTDAIVGRSNFDGYFKAGESAEFSARFVNAGTTVINSFDAVVKVGANSSTLHFDGLNIQPKDGYSFKIDGIDADSEGEQAINVTIANVNGAGTEGDTSDNSIEANVFFYPNNMERTLLVEGFTGQECSQCPSGHLTIESAIESSKKNIVEVSHHAGYQPDMFTMLEDDTYRFYYSNPTRTYAPAVMVNRNAYDDVSTFPVINPELNDILTLIYNADASKPYVSLNLETALDKTTRELNVKLQILPHTNLPSKNVLFNAFLVQDGIVGYQASGGSNYVHNRVFRGAITGNAWGIEASDLSAGNVSTWEKTLTIPEKIHSSYWTDDMLSNGKYNGEWSEEQTNIEAVLENMTLVAFVAEYDTEDKTKNVVFNCCEVKLGESHKQSGFTSTTSVKTADATNNDVRIFVNNGKVSVGGTYDNLAVYNLAGAKVDADKTLARGVYLVQVSVGGKLTTKKILVK